MRNLNIFLTLGTISFLRKILFKNSKMIFVTLSLILSTPGFSEEVDYNEHSILNIFTENSFNDVDYHRETVDSCQVEVSAESENFIKPDPKADPCMKDGLLYKIKKLKFSNCNWVNRVSDSPIERLQPEIENSVLNSLTLNNVEIFLRDNLMLCRGDLFMPSFNKSVKLEGLCGLPFKRVNTQDLEAFKAGAMMTFFKPVGVQNALIESLNKSFKVEGEQISLVIGMAIPVSKKAMKGIRYFLSDQSINACKNKPASK